LFTYHQFEYILGYSFAGTIIYNNAWFMLKLDGVDIVNMFI